MYIVCYRAKGTDDWYPIHPGHIDADDADKLVRMMKRKHKAVRTFTTEQYSYYEEDVLWGGVCDDCGEYRCNCQCEEA